ncbi:MAG: hypothetical protein U5J78_05810 [Parasphingorhabdus sp.]|nr:hypothetical protein [Parasphingorhabdus sp.]
MPIAKRFAYVERMKGGEERLMLAEFDRFRKPNVTAHNVREMARVPGDPPSGGDIPESYAALATSHDNGFVAALSVQVGLDFIDYNYAIFSFDTGLQVVRFNEHSFTGTNRANCPCPLFDAFLASEAALGVPPADLAAYDYGIDAESGSIGAPTMQWTDAGTLLVNYGFDVVAHPAGFIIGQDRFEYEVEASGPGLNILGRNAVQPIMAPPPVSHLSLGTVPGAPGASYVRFKNIGVRFGLPKHWLLPIWFPFPFGRRSRLVTATRVSGFGAP